MMYNVELTCIYNGNMTVAASSKDEAIQTAQDALNAKTLEGFPNCVAIPNGYFTFGEATADYAQVIKQ